MKSFRFLLLGIFFGIVMVKSEAVSWYRIQEMFRFQSFHMYGIIGTAVVTGMIIVGLMRKWQMKDASGYPIQFPDKKKGWKNYLFGGIIFGLGWALTGACPGPIFINIGYGYLSFIIIAASAVLGTFIYGLIKDRLPH